MTTDRPVLLLGGLSLFVNCTDVWQFLQQTWVQFSGLTAPSHRKGVERVLVAERMAEVVMWSGY